VLPEQFRGPCGPSPGRAAARTRGAALRAQAWQSGCSILVPGSGRGSTPAATAGALPHLAVAAATGP